MITAVKRASDGLLADVQISPQLPQDPTRRIQNAVGKFGGSTADWSVVAVPESLWVGINPLARQSAEKNGEVISDISESTPPALSSDVDEIDNDGVDTATLTCDVGDAGYDGAVVWQVILPDGTALTETEDMIAGVATLELTTTLEGPHEVIVETATHGVARMTVEGI